jgi:hypothetical protein
LRRASSQTPIGESLIMGTITPKKSSLDREVVNTVGSTSPTEDNPASSDEEQRNGHYGSTSEHVFSDPAVADYWRLKYEKAGYENRHRFDPEAEWSAEEEKKLVHKVSCIGDIDPSHHGRPPLPKLTSCHRRLTKESWSGPGLCFARLIYIEETLIARFQTIW